MLAAALLASADTALAVSWQWQRLDNRERLTIYLDAPGQAKVERTERTAVTVTLPTPPQNVTQAPGSANPAAALVTKVSGQGQSLVIGLKAPAFGYITTTPNPRQVQIDFFADPLGARWKPKPGAEKQAETAAETPPVVTGSVQTQPEKTASPAPEKTVQGATPPPDSGQTAASKTETQSAQATPPASGGLQEKDIKDAPPPTPLDTLFSILTDKAAEEKAAGEQSPEPPPAQTAEQPPQQTAGVAMPPVQTQERTPTQAAPQPQPPVQTQAQTPPATAAPESTPTQPPTALGGQDSTAAAPKGNAAAVDYGFVGSITPPGQENQDAQAPAQNADSAPVTAVAPPPQDTQAAQVQTIQPQAAQTRVQNETSDALEEVIKNPPAMVSTTGQLAQAQNNITPVSQPPDGRTVAQNATNPDGRTQSATAQDAAPSGAPEVAQEIAQPVDTPPDQHAPQAVEAASGQIDAPPGTPGATAAGQIFGTVEQAPEQPGAASGHNATAVAAEEHAPEPPPQLDADGNPIPPPPDPDAMLADAGKALAARDYQAAQDAYKAILALSVLTDAQREAAMYGVSDAEFGLGQENLPEHFAQIVDATERAMNFNLQSPRVPSLMLRLGFVNMKMDNVQEAEAYFNMLKRKYPNDPNIPLTYYYWGDYFFKKDDFRRASDQFQYIVQNYPDSRYVRESSMGLARSLYNLGYYEQSYQVGEYIDKRWPRFYVEYPSVLTMFGDMAIRLDKLDDARRYYWTYYNIAPTGSDADTSLVHLGDIYMQQGKPEAAKEVYQNAAQSFPDKDGGLIAQMRLAEEGVHDRPMIPEMDALFDKGYNLRPMEVYTHIINDFPDSKLAPLATLKLAMWDLWNKRYEDAIQTCEQFAAKYPKHELLPNIQEVALTAFSRLTADALPENDYGRILRAWNAAPALQGLESRLTPEVRLSLSLSKVNQNNASDALADLDPFFRGAKDPQFGDSALTLALSTLVDTQSWSQIEPLALRVSTWELKPETKAQLDYARALAFENLGQPENALPLWEELKHRGDLPMQLQAYTLYFLSRAALRNNDMGNAYQLSRQALGALSDIAEADPTKADMAKIKTLLGSLLDITESSGRTAEALEWYQQYAQYVRESDEEWPSLRFRLAQLYKASGDVERWSSILKELASQHPDTLYGKMAVSELETHKLRQNISEFMSPTGQ